MISQGEKLKNRQLRGQIMRTVSLFHPSPVTVNQLKLALREYGMINEADVEKHLYFLAEDSDPNSPPYIRTEQGFIEGLRDNDKVYITKAGIRLVEGDIDDDAVML